MEIVNDYDSTDEMVEDVVDSMFSRMVEVRDLQSGVISPTQNLRLIDIKKNLVDLLDEFDYQNARVYPNK